MKKLLLPRIPQFSTKKRSSDLFWIYLALITIAALFVGALIVDDMSRARFRHTKFFNVQSVNYSFLRTTQNESETFLRSQSPLFVFENERVLIGPAAELLSPRPAAPIIMSSYSGWLEELTLQIAKGKLSQSFFDSQLIGVAINRSMNLGERAALLSTIRSATERLRSQIGGDQKVPTIVFVQMRARAQ